jgi:hypothetical protein
MPKPLSETRKAELRKMNEVIESVMRLRNEYHLDGRGFRYMNRLVSERMRNGRVEGIPERFLRGIIDVPEEQISPRARRLIDEAKRLLKVETPQVIER